MLILRVLYIYSTRQHLKMLAISVAQFVQSESTRYTHYEVASQTKEP